MTETETEPRMSSPGIAPAPRPEERPSGLTSLDVAFLGLLTLLLACHAAAALLALGPITAALTDALALAYLAALAARRSWRPLIVRLLLLGLVAGVLELATDAAGHDFAHSLIYQPGAPQVWASPAYMPFSWMIVLAELGYLGWRLAGLAPRVPLRLAMLLAGLAGAINILFYEETAYYAGWWRYTPTRLTFGHTPAYVFFFEGLICAALPLLTRRIESRSLWGVVARGALLGAWMPVAALAAWLALGRW